MVHRELESIQTARLPDLLLWGLRRRKRFRVVGQSMVPTLRAGDELLIDPRAYRNGPPCIGDLVVVRHPLRPDMKLVKRVARVDRASARVELAGDNPEASTDSRAFGSVSAELVVGRVERRLP